MTFFVFSAAKGTSTNQELDNRLDDLPERVESTLHFNSAPHHPPPPPVQAKEKPSSRMEVSSSLQPPKPLESSPLLQPTSRPVATYATVASNVPPVGEMVAPMGVDPTPAVKAVAPEVKTVVVPSKAVASESVTPVLRMPIVEKNTAPKPVVTPEAPCEWSKVRHSRKERYSEPIMSIEEHSNRFVSDDLPMEVESQEVESDCGESYTVRSVRPKKSNKKTKSSKRAPLARNVTENIPKEDNELDIGGYFKNLSPTDLYSKLRGQLDSRDRKTTQDKQKSKRVRRLPAERSRRRFMLHFSQLAESDYDTFTAVDAKDILKMRSVGGLKYPVPPFNTKEKSSAQPNEVTAQVLCSHRCRRVTKRVYVLGACVVLDVVS